MKESKNLDRLFQEKFRDFEQVPPAAVWSNIEAELEAKKKDKRFLWLWIGSIAAGLALLFNITGVFNTNQTIPVTTGTQKTETKQPVFESKTETEIIQNNSKYNTPISTTTLSNTTSTFISQQENNTSPVTNTIKEPFLEKELSTIPIRVKSTNTVVTASNTKMEKIRKIDKDEIVKNNSIENKEKENIALADLTDDENELLKKKKEKKWSVSTVAAPMYLSSFDKMESSIDEVFDENDKQGLFSKAYGVDVAYNLSSRFSLQTGVHFVDYGYKTLGVYVKPNNNSLSHMASIDIEANADTMEYEGSPGDTPTDIYQTFSMEEGDITQIFGYVEIPVEVKYKLIDSRIGVSAIGGFSTMILNKNDIFIETENFTNRVGSANNLNTLNVSGNAGIEFGYKLYENVHFNLVPMFKVHTSTFQKGTKNFKPYAMGVYSGLQLRF